ncbi:MAG: Pelagibacter phage, partial [Bacteroidota bacterium]
ANTSITNAQLVNSTISGIALGSNLATLTIGTGLSGTSYNGSGAVTIANTGVTSITGTSNQVVASTSTGGVTLSLPQSIATSSDVRFNSIGIGMAASATAGRIDAAGDIVAFSTSDKNFKENIKPIENALEKISKISGNTYDWKEDMKEYHGFEGNDVGVIAQEIESVLPQLVTTRETGYKAVKYDKLVALLIEGIKEQQTQIHKLTLEVENLKKQKGL